jgi:muramoyltetrapeptide carboxypeptidase
MLLQLDRAGKLQHLSGLIIGGFSDCKDTAVGFGKNINEIIQYRVHKYNFPVAFGFPVSHEKENVALKTGLVHRLQVTKSGAVLTEGE